MENNLEERLIPIVREVSTLTEQEKEEYIYAPTKEPGALRIFNYLHAWRCDSSHPDFSFDYAA